MDLTALYLLALPAFLYWRGVRILAARGYRVPRSQQWCWFAGLASIGAALLSPLDHLGETDLLSAHMAQHLLLADLSAPLLVLGARSPVYAFLLPRPVWAARARSQRLRSVLRTGTKPCVAAPLWIVILYSGTSPAYDAALRHPFLHALQHQCFIIGSLLVWISVLEPTTPCSGRALEDRPHRRHRFAGMFLGWRSSSATPAYDGFYGHRALEHGFRPTTTSRSLAD